MSDVKDRVILFHRVRTLDLARVTAVEIAGRVQNVTDPTVRAAVRAALAHQLGLDAPAATDGAGPV